MIGIESNGFKNGFHEVIHAFTSAVHDIVVGILRRASILRNQFFINRSDFACPGFWCFIESINDFKVAIECFLDGIEFFVEKDIFDGFIAIQES